MFQVLAGRGTLAVSAALLLIGGTTACSTTVSKEEAAKQISAALEKQVGQRPDSVTCPEDLPAEVGRSIRCELTAGGETLGLTAKVKSVNDGRVRFDIQVDER